MAGQMFNLVANQSNAKRYSQDISRMRARGVVFLHLRLNWLRGLKAITTSESIRITQMYYSGDPDSKTLALGLLTQKEDDYLASKNLKIDEK